MLTKRVITGQLSIDEFGSISVRTDTIIEEDGVELSRTYHRAAFTPDLDPKTIPVEAQPIAQVMWTPDVVQTFQAIRAKAQADFQARFGVPAPVVAAPLVDVTAQ
jgi:hypothetical protein